jgi:hypothetical protein
MFCTGMPGTLFPVAFSPASDGSHLRSELNPAIPPPPRGTTPMISENPLDLTWASAQDGRAWCSKHKTAIPAGHALRFDDVKVCYRLMAVQDDAAQPEPSHPQAGRGAPA